MFFICLRHESSMIFLPLEVESYYTIGKLKILIEQVYSIPAENQNLFLSQTEKNEDVYSESNCIPLKNDKATLQSYGFKAGVKVIIFKKEDGGNRSFSL